MLFSEDYWDLLLPFYTEKVSMVWFIFSFETLVRKLGMLIDRS